MAPANRKSIYVSQVCFNSFLINYVLHENKIRKKYKPRKLFAERKARISMPMFGKFLWKILQHGK